MGEPSVGGAELASSGMRVLAHFLDQLIIGLVFSAIFAAIILSGDNSAGFGGVGIDASFGETYLLAIISAVAFFVWDAVCTKQFGGTPMKLAFGMKVVQADSGADVEWEHAIKRWALPGALSLIPPVAIVSGLITLLQIVIVIVSLVFIFSKPLRQAVWDQFADTVVVKSR